MKRIKIVKLEYETKDKTLWKACVLAYSIDEAIKSIINSVPTYDRLISTGMIGEVDMISKPVFDDYFKRIEVSSDDKLTEGNVKSNIKNNKQTSKPVNNPPSPQKEEDDNSGFVCPVCKKEYKTNKTFVRHIKKMH